MDPPSAASARRGQSDGGPRRQRRRRACARALAFALGAPACAGRARRAPAAVPTAAARGPPPRGAPARARRGATAAGCGAALAAHRAAAAAAGCGAEQPRLGPAAAARAAAAAAGGGRRWLVAAAAAAACWRLRARPARGAKPACGSVDECRELGDRRFEEAERRKGAIVKLGAGVRYRETAAGAGPAVSSGDVVEVTYEVRKTNGDYIYSLGRGRPDRPGDDFGETYRVRLGQQDVPVAVERAMEGMRKGGARTVEMPPQLGFETSGWKPEPVNFSGRQRMERYRKLLTGNGLQKGYNAALLFEVEVVKVRPQGSAAG